MGVRVSDRIYLDSDEFLRVDIGDRAIRSSLFTDIYLLKEFLKDAELGTAEVYLFHSAMFGVLPPIQKEIMSACQGPKVLTVDGYDYLSFLTSNYFDTYEQVDLAYPDLPTEELHLTLIENALEWGCRFNEPGELARELVKAVHFPQLSAVFARFL